MDFHNKFKPTAFMICSTICVNAQSDLVKLKNGIASFEARNGTQAIELLKPLAEKGNPRSQFYLGQIYREGPGLFPGVEKDEELGDSWIQKAADAGLPEAEYFVGVSYLIGFGKPKDIEAALVWITKAANHSDVHAMAVMGNACWGGDPLEGVPRNPKVAMTWFKKAARKSDSHSMFMIALMYEKGIGVPQDYIEAHAWMNLAASKEELIPEFSRDQRESIARKMTATQIAQAQARAKVLKKELNLN